MSSAPLTFLFTDDGAVPNNPLPMLVYRAALDLSASRDPEGDIERLFADNGWGHGAWRNGIYPFAHYHSMIHEVLGIARGSGQVRFGGDAGQVLDLAPGDVACCLPAPAISGCRPLPTSSSSAAIHRPAPIICAEVTNRQTALRP